MGLNARVGIEAFVCIVSSSPSFAMEPQWYFTSKELEEYLSIAIRKRWDTTEVGRLVEGFALSGSSVLGNSLWPPHFRLLRAINFFRCFKHLCTEGSLSSWTDS